MSEQAPRDGEVPRDEEGPRAEEALRDEEVPRDDVAPRDEQALSFEAVQSKHVEALVALFERNALAVSDSFDPFPLTAAQAKAIALDRHEDLYFIALRGERPVGMSMLRGFDEGYEIPSFGIFVDSEHHGRGIGRALTVWTIEQAHLRGCPAVRLSVYAENAAARGLYASLGFQEQERLLGESGVAGSREQGRLLGEGGVVGSGSAGSRSTESSGEPREKLVMRLELGG
jgi:ribosomal-protein-alanine N-acetyltransferase